MRKPIPTILLASAVLAVIAFGAGCGGTCDLRTINLAGGSIFIEETFSDFSCPGVCQTGRSDANYG